MISGTLIINSVSGQVRHIRMRITTVQKKGEGTLLSPPAPAPALLPPQLKNVI